MGHAPRLLLVALAAAVVVLIPGPVEAELPSEVVEGAGDDGVFVAPGVEGHDEAALASVVDDARRLDLKMLLVAPEEPLPTAEAFALRVMQAADADIAVVFAPDGQIQASVEDDLRDREVAALEAARSASSSHDAAAAYLSALTAERDDSLPGTVRWIVTVVIILFLLLVAATVFEQFVRRSSDPVSA